MNVLIEELERELRRRKVKEHIYSIWRRKIFARINSKKNKKEFWRMYKWN